MDAVRPRRAVTPPRPTDARGASQSGPAAQPAYAVQSSYSSLHAQTHVASPSRPQAHAASSVNPAAPGRDSRSPTGRFDGIPRSSLFAPHMDDGATPASSGRGGRMAAAAFPTYAYAHTHAQTRAAAMAQPPPHIYVVPPTHAAQNGYANAALLAAPRPKASFLAQQDAARGTHTHAHTHTHTASHAMTPMYAQLPISAPSLAADAPGGHARMQLAQAPGPAFTAPPEHAAPHAHTYTHTHTHAHAQPAASSSNDMMTYAQPAPEPPQQHFMHRHVEGAEVEDAAAADDASVPGFGWDHTHAHAHAHAHTQAGSYAQSHSHSRARGGNAGGRAGHRERTTTLPRPVTPPFPPAITLASAAGASPPAGAPASDTARPRPMHASSNAHAQGAARAHTGGVEHAAVAAAEVDGMSVERAGPARADSSRVLHTVTIEPKPERDDIRAQLVALSAAVQRAEERAIAAENLAQQVATDPPKPDAQGDAVQTEQAEHIAQMELHIGELTRALDAERLRVVELQTAHVTATQEWERQRADWGVERQRLLAEAEAGYVQLYTNLTDKAQDVIARLRDELRDALHAAEAEKSRVRSEADAAIAQAREDARRMLAVSRDQYDAMLSSLRQQLDQENAASASKVEVLQRHALDRIQAVEVHRRAFEAQLEAAAQGAIDAAKAEAAAARQDLERERARFAVMESQMRREYQDHTAAFEARLRAKVSSTIAEARKRQGGGSPVPVLQRSVTASDTDATGAAPGVLSDAVVARTVSDLRDFMAQGGSLRATVATDGASTPSRADSTARDERAKGLWKPKSLAVFAASTEALSAALAKDAAADAAILPVQPSGDPLHAVISSLPPDQQRLWQAMQRDE